MEHHSEHQAIQLAILTVNHQLDAQQEVCPDCCTTHEAGFQYTKIQLQHKYLILQCHLACLLEGVSSNLVEFLLLVNMVV